MQGQASQSLQTAPFDYYYNYNNVTPATTIYDSTKTVFNSYKGGVLQEALSALTFLNGSNYVGSNGGYSKYGFEYNPSRGSDGYVTWSVDGSKTWTVTTASLPPSSEMEIGQRLIPEEPMVSFLLEILTVNHTDESLVHDSQLWHVAWFPRAGLFKAQVPSSNAC